MKLLSSRIFNTRIRSEHVSGKERWLGYFWGPIGATLLSGILTSYLNVYYTDVIDISGIWGGAFLSSFPLVCRILNAVTFVLMGRLIDRTVSPQGKARPWILISTPILLVSMILLFLVPEGSDWLRAVWVFCSYTLFFSVGYTAYGASHTLLVPLSTKDVAERGKLSVFSNAQYMLSGMFLAILFPCVLVPMMGVNRSAWMITITIMTCIACPMFLLEYYYTRERVTESNTRVAGQEQTAANRHGQNTQSVKKRTKNASAKVLTIREQVQCCFKSRYWVLVMIYVVVNSLVNALSSAAIFYYCNWVLGSYNDGYTQALFYGLGNMPLGIGIFLCGPLCKKLGRRNAMMGGFVVAVAGCLLCVLNPTNLILVLAGQFIKAIGLIPSNYMLAAMLADALDDVEMQSGERCDGFSSSVYNIVGTISSGVALGIFNACLVRFGYQAPSAMEVITGQNELVQGFFIFGALGSQLIGYALLAMIMFFMPKSTTIHAASVQG